MTVGSWETTKSHLESLVDAGQLTVVTDDGDTRCKIDPMRAYLDHIQELVVENTKDELRDELMSLEVSKVLIGTVLLESGFVADFASFAFPI